MSLWLNMGGYAPYVWSSYGCVFVGLIIFAIQLYFQKQHLKKNVRRYQEMNLEKKRSSKKVVVIEMKKPETNF